MEIKHNVSLKPYNAWKAGGSAEWFCTPSSLKELGFALTRAKEHKNPVHILGGGTNTLVSDYGVKGLTISLEKLNHLQVWKSEGRLHILAEAGVKKADVLGVFSRHRLAPALFLSGIPGQVGGGVVMNAGTSLGESDLPKEFKDIVDYIMVLQDLHHGKNHDDKTHRENKDHDRKDSSFPAHSKMKTLYSKDLDWGYRFCKNWSGCIYKVKMSYPLKPLAHFFKRLKSQADYRKNTQPLLSINSGSVFKNQGPKIKAGALIEQCGLKDFQIGRAKVSGLHANFIINSGGATALDIHKLIVHIQSKVKERFNILLEPEVQYFGSWEKAGLEKI